MSDPLNSAHYSTANYLRMQDSTRSDSSRNLCASCKNGVVMKGSSHSAETVYCQEISKFLPIKIVECSNYRDKTSLSLGELEEIAWVVQPRERGKWGIQSPDDRQREDEVRQNSSGFTDAVSKPLGLPR